MTEKQKRAMTIQDISCMGRCSLTVALPILSAAGIETLIIPTAILSTHTGGFTNYTFRDLTEDIEPICDHWLSLGEEVDALYTGYLGSLGQQQLMVNLFESFDKGDPIILVDPAMADQGKLYPAFDLEFALGMRDVVAKASITVPNITEACFLLEKEYPGTDYDKEWVEQTLKELTALGPKQAVLTGISYDSEKLGAVAYDRETDQFVSYFNEYVPGYFHGTGDIYSSTLLAALLADKPLSEAIRIACEFTVGAIKRTDAAKTEPKYGVDFENGLGQLILMLEKA